MPISVIFKVSEHSDRALKFHQNPVRGVEDIVRDRPTDDDMLNKQTDRQTDGPEQLRRINASPFPPKFIMNDKYESQAGTTNPSE